MNHPNSNRAGASTTACWRRVDQPGHDTARLQPLGNGWLLTGAAVFLSATGPALVNYGVKLAHDWTTLAGTVRGFRGKQEFELTVVRDGEDWTINGQPQPAVRGLLDLDFQFTPATNLQQLRRLNLTVGQRADCPVAWLQEGASELAVLPQTYQRLDEFRYGYDASAVGYQATLIIAENGFARVYPDGWEFENEPGRNADRR
jgi:uncharacterized protein